MPFCRPCLLPDDLIYTLSTDEKKKALFAKQGASDWETFLLHRCRELVPGKAEGILISRIIPIVYFAYLFMPWQRKGI